MSCSLLKHTLLLPINPIFFFAYGLIISWPSNFELASA
jgi:hypothetical protein